MLEPHLSSVVLGTLEWRLSPLGLKPDLLRLEASCCLMEIVMGPLEQMSTETIRLDRQQGP